LWNSGAMNEFADLQFLNYHAMLPRLFRRVRHDLLEGRRQLPRRA